MQRHAWVFLLLAGACRTAGGPTSRLPVPEGADAMDQHSHAEPHRVRATHVSLDLTLDFAAHQVRGTASTTFDRLDPTAPWCSTHRVW
jgi:hypothetical protein